MPYKLSPTKINLFIECPRCFWLDLHKEWSRPAGIFPSLPSGMDKILKEHFDRFIGKSLPPEICSNGECEGMRLFGEGKEKALLDDWRNNFRGIRHEDKEKNVLFGAIDNILVKGKKLVVLDYKTRGYPLKEDTHEHYQLQLDMYTYLLRENGYKTEDYSFLLFYYPDKVMPTGEILFETRLVKMKVDHEHADKVFKDALKCLEGEKPGKGCGWCKLVK